MFLKRCDALAQNRNHRLKPLIRGVHANNGHRRRQNWHIRGQAERIVVPHAQNPVAPVVPDHPPGGNIEVHHIHPAEQQPNADASGTQQIVSAHQSKHRNGPEQTITHLTVQKSFTHGRAVPLCGFPAARLARRTNDTPQDI